MVRVTLGWFFVMLYLVALLRPVQPLIDYVVRYDLYSKVLCVNRDKPDMKCNGQCILMQRLKAASNQDDKPFTPSTAFINFQDYPIGFVSLLELKAQWFLSGLNVFKNISALHLPEVYLSIFQPPS